MKQTQTTELREFVQERKDLPLEQRIEARQRLEELAKTGLGVERLPRENLAQALANSHYSRISPEFLRQHQTLKDTVQAKGELRVPKFGVYELNDPHMIIFFEKREFGEYVFRVSSPKNLPIVLSEQLLFSTEFGRDNHPELWDHYPLESRRYSGMFCRKDKRLPKKLPIWYSLSSLFYGFIPETTKQEIKEAREIFDHSLFLVAETKPEDWAVKSLPPPRLIEDPLILGVIGGKCYLVDHFDTSPVEDYARKEFSSP